MRFAVDPELVLFAQSVRGALDGWAPALEPALGEWGDEHDEALAGRLAELGWQALWAHESLLGACVAGGIELGRAVAPLSLVDVPTLGGSLAVDGRARHLGAAEGTVAAITPGGLVLGKALAAGREATGDATGTVRVATPSGPTIADERRRLRAWTTATVAYLAGLTAVALERSVAHATSREQFGAPLASLPVVQARLADASLHAGGIELLAWECATRDGADGADALAWATGASCEVAAIAHQVHGAVGFALESGLHRLSRRAASARAWALAALATLPMPTLRAR